MKKLFRLALTLLSVSLPALMTAVASTPPVAPVHLFTQKVGKHQLTDNYHWLKDKTRTNPEVLKYIEAENKYGDEALAPTKDLQQKLYNEMISHINEEDVTVPYRHGDFFYYSRDEKGLQYPLMCRKKQSMTADEDVYLDINKLAADKEFYSVGFTTLSPDQNLLAFAADTAGDENYTLQVKDLNNGKIYPDLADSTADAVFAGDNRTIFYCTNDDSGRSWRAWRMDYVTGKKELLFEEKDAAFYLGFGKSADEKYIMLSSASKTTTEYYFLPTDQPWSKMVQYAKRRHNVEYYLDYAEGWFYLLTNEDAPNFKIVRTHNPDATKTEPFYPAKPGVYVTSMELYKDFTVVFTRVDGLPRMEIIPKDTGTAKLIDFPDPVYTITAGMNPDYDTPYYRFSYESLVSPYIIYLYHIKEDPRVAFPQKPGTLEVIKEDKVPGNFDKDLYTSEVLYVPSGNVKVPVAVLYRKDTFKGDGSNPLLLEGYGSYGDTNDCYFSSARLSLLDRGFVYAVAHIRGGGEMGRQWYEDGKMLNKKHTFEDFIAAAEFLQKKGYTASDRMVCAGGSAGGLLMGAVINARPELFKACVADVPFVDVLNTMLDPSLPATVSEYEEWGNPEQEPYQSYIMSYCPYQNVKKQNYPNLYITGGFYDTRVNYWEPLKWTAKLRALKTDKNLLVCHIQQNGHAGASGRYDYLHDIAREYAFMLYITGTK